MDIIHSLFDLLLLFFLPLFLFFLFDRLLLCFDLLILLLNLLISFLNFMNLFIQLSSLLFNLYLVLPFRRRIRLPQLLKLLGGIKCDDLYRELLSLSFSDRINLDNIWKFFSQSISYFLNISVKNVVEPICSNKQLIKLILSELL